MNFDKINELEKKLPTNSRMPSNPQTHYLALSDHAIQLLSSKNDIQNYITFIVLQPEQKHLLTNKLIKSVHCIIVKEVGVILSSACSQKTENILEHFVKWAPYTKVCEKMELYQR